MISGATKRTGIKGLIVDSLVLPTLNFLLRIHRLQLPEYISIRERFQFLLAGYDNSVAVVARQILQQGDSVADIGAHVGLLTRPFARIVGEDGHVYAFEPDPSLFAMLKSNVGRLKQVKASQLAMADYSHTASFHLHPTSGMSNSLVNAWEGASSIQVKCSSFDDWASANEPRLLKLIKIDVEGAEPLVLRGMTRVLGSITRPHIIIEYCPGNLGSESAEKEIFEIFFAHGYQVYAIGEGGSLKVVNNVAAANRALNSNGYVNLLAKPPNSKVAT
jgi:FkbM family methyltransferase